MKNELKIFLPMKTYEKGGPAFKWSLQEYTNLFTVITPQNISKFSLKKQS